MTEQNTETTRRKVLKATSGGLAGASVLVSGTAAAQQEPDLRNLMIYKDVSARAGGEQTRTFEEGDALFPRVEYYGLDPDDTISLYGDESLGMDNFIVQRQIGDTLISSPDSGDPEIGTCELGPVVFGQFDEHIENGILELVAVSQCMGGSCDAVSNTVTLEQTDYGDDGWF